MARLNSQSTNKGQRQPNNVASPKEPPKKHKKLDTSFLIIILVLLTYGIIMVFSASYASAKNEYGDSMHYISRHFLFVVGGLIAMFMASYVDYHLYRRVVFWIFSGAFVLLALVPIIGTDLGTIAKRWIAVGSFSFQPSEIMKFAVIVLFSHLIALNYKRMGTFTYGVIPFAICLMAVAGLMMLQPHLSGTVLLFLLGFIMMFVGGTKLRYFLGLIACGGIGIGGIIAIKGADYIVGRLQSWLNPFAGNIQEETWQIVQSLVAIGSGGLMGRGIGMSRQKYLYLPEPQNDFIFAIICEELGLIGALMVIVLFIMFALRGFSIASKAPDKFGYMMGVGLTVQILIQAVLNIGVVTSTIPNTGISLPFFSYGGTALLMQLGQMGILLNISRQASLEKT
ncbi:MAG: putative lipid II flippase FtsW [Oscillospiraceae bacterium]